MKNVFICLGLLALFTGCGKGDARPPGVLGVYPALNESPPPLLLSVPDSSGPSSAESVDSPARVITGDGWMQRQTEMAEQVKRLRAYAAQAKPGDPAALTEEQIRAFSKLDNPRMY